MAVAVLTLLPWSAIAWPIAALPALSFAAECDRRQEDHALV